MKLLKLLALTLIFIITLASCSTDEGPGYVGLDDISLQVSSLTAKGPTLSYTGAIDNPEGKPLFYGIKKKGASTSKRYPLEKDLVINDLNPVTSYEVRIVYDLNNGEEKETFTIVEEFFTPLLFALTREANSYMDFNEIYIYSHEGFDHILSKSDTNVDTSEIYLVNENDSIQPSNLTIFEDRIEFSIPEKLLSDEPYEYFKDYRIGVKSGDTYHYLVNAFDADNGFANRPTKIRIFNRTPFIEKTFENEIRDISECKGKAYFVSFGGYFFTTKNGAFQIFNMPGLTEKSDAIITRISDGKEFLLNDRPFNDFDGCFVYDRISSIAFEGGLKEFPSLHYARTAYVQLPINASGDFVPGDYKVKFTFTWNDQFYETNEFPFTLE